MYSFCKVEDLERVQIGQELVINSRCSELKRKDGSVSPFVAKKDDVVIVLEKLHDKLLVFFYEDTTVQRVEELYGPFLIEPYQIQAF